MSSIPMFAFSAFSGTGKTTLIEKIVVNLKAKGLRVAVIKHDAHKFEIDREGKDSWKFTQAGADMVILGSPEKTAIIEQRERTLRENLSMVHDVDLILVEGFSQEDIPRIGISRKATGQGLRHAADAYVAIVTDDDTIQTDNPKFGLEDIDEIVAFLLK